MIKIPAIEKFSLNIFKASNESDVTNKVAPIIKYNAVLFSNFWYCQRAADNMVLMVTPYMRTGMRIGPSVGQSM